MKISGNLYINNTYRPTYKRASQPAGLEGIVVDLGGYDASEMLRYCKTLKYISSGKIKQMKTR